ncbi:aldehyde reductase [Arthrobacter sp. GMC3]|uniref:SDR family oxidoreductase n=1 Tax=Arthrobacter sp. GMC3 TaxID=2058894 RepID=UPI000CE4C78A|nr:aldehyde reductase [Arthrobacter sp. GMC3]
MPTSRVLVTGGSGFIAGHCILQLLDAGYEVRTTVRSLAKETLVREVLADAGMVDGGALSFVAADLTSDEGWPEAVADVDFVLHVASPVQPGHIDNENELIIPAREGAVRVLRAARDAGVKRAVLTSAFHAVSWGHPHDGHVFTEADWTVLDGPGVDAYAKSKTLAEQAAWELMANSSTELVTMLPVAVMGPVMGRDVTGSNHLIQGMLNGAMPATPRLFIPIVDVRDVARAHILAMTTPEAAGQRFLLSNGPAIEMTDIAATIRARLSEGTQRVPTQTIPDEVVRAAAESNPQFREMLPDLGYAKKTSNDKARNLLGWSPRDAAEAIASAAESMVKKVLGAQ